MTQPNPPGEYAGNEPDLLEVQRYAVACLTAELGEARAENRRLRGVML